MENNINNESISYLENNLIDIPFITCQRTYKIKTIPTIVDYDVLVALFSIFSKNNKEIVIKFGLNQLLKEMGYTSDGGSITNRIKLSIERLAKITIKNEYSGISFRIIQDFYIYDKTQYTSHKRDFSYVKLSELLYKSIQNGYCTYFNYDIYKELHTACAKRLFLCLTKMRKKYLIQPLNTIHYLALYH